MLQPEFTLEGCLDATDIILCGSRAALVVVWYSTAYWRDKPGGSDPNRARAKNAQFCAIYQPSGYASGRISSGSPLLWAEYREHLRSRDAPRRIFFDGVFAEESAPFRGEAWAGVAPLRRALAAKKAKPTFDPKVFFNRRRF